ncbi:MAG: hypothetical protein ACE5NP_10815 [Anaerolineae bacterium]
MSILFPSPRQLLPTLLFASIFAMACREITDPDYWWHLRTGQYILETRSVPYQDPFSLTMQGQPWITHEWLSEVLMYGLYNTFGSPGPILAFAAIITAAFFMVYRQCPGRPHLAVFTTLLAALASAVTWGPRPQMITMFLASLLLYLLHLHREGRRNLLWLIPLLIILWANAHSGYILGLALLLAVISGQGLGKIVNRLSQGKEAQEGVMQIGYFAAITASSIVAATINPNGIKLLSYPFATLTSQAMQTYIQEWHSPDFHNPQFIPFALLLLATLGALALSRSSIDATDLILLLAFSLASLISARHIPIFALVAPPILTAALLQVGRSWGLARPGTREEQGRFPPRWVLAAINWFLLALILVGVAVKAGTALANNRAVEEQTFPSAAVEYLLESLPPGPMYNSYNWGGYLIWRLYPHYKVFIDGRADVYGDQFINFYMQAFRAKSNWQEPLDDYYIRMVLIEREGPLSTLLQESPQWQRTYADHLAAIYIREGEMQ